MGRIVARNQVPEKKKNRRIFHGSVGVTTVTWLVPPGVTEVEVHCWGAGATGIFGSNGGGGGGYVTHVFPVTSSDRLLITAGASPGGTSSVSVPTQSPISPISATGGSSNGPGGAGAYTIAPGISTARTFSASGGAGPLGGGSAGSPFGPGGNGGLGGGGIGGPGGALPPVSAGAGGGSLSGASWDQAGHGKGAPKSAYATITPSTTSFTDGTSVSSDDWFYVDEILGSGGTSHYNLGPGVHAGMPGGAGAGGGAGNPVPAFGYGGAGGILGGGGVGYYGGHGGLGGGGGYSPQGQMGIGGAGLVILYW